MVSSRTAGRFSRLDLAYATGEVPFSGSDDEKPKMSLIEAAFQECPLERLEADTLAVTEAIANIRGIESAVTKQVGAGNMRSLDDVVKELEGVRKILADRLARRAPSASSVAEPAAAGTNGAAVASNGAAAPAAAAWNGEITSRSQAIKAIEGVCRYFEQYEPSSPLPLLLHRAMRLSTKSFLEIMRDISPDGLSQAESLGGMTSDEYLRLMTAGQTQRSAPTAPTAATPAAASAPAAADNDY
jgi:type VI secretion system protein ImpA